jgi:hypothetical protein
MSRNRRIRSVISGVVVSLAMLLVTAGSALAGGNPGPFPR